MKHGAFLLALLVGCGDDGAVGHLRDAPLASATVTLLSGRNPIANHMVYFQAPDGALIEAVATDADGKASAIVPEGSSVTALDLREILRPEIRAIQTIMGVSPGDQLTMSGDAGIVKGPLDVAYPAYANPDLGGYAVVTTCGGGDVVAQTSQTVTIDQCSARIDTIVYAYDTNFDPLAYVVKLDQPITGPIDLTSETWAAMPTSTTRYTNLPLADVQQVYATRDLLTPNGRFGCREAGLEPTDLTSNVKCPIVAGTLHRDSFTMTDNIIYATVSQRVTTPSPTYDLADTLIKAPTSSAGVDASTRRVMWTETSAGAEPDFVMLNLSSGAAGRAYYWDILAPYSATLTLPALAGDAAPYAIQPGDEIGGQIEVGAATGGYDAIRPFGPQYGASLTDQIERLIIASQYDG